MALGERQGRSQLSAIFSLSENVRALFFLGRTGASPTAALKGRAKVKRQPHWLSLSGSTSRRLLSKKTARMGDKAKPSVCSIDRRLCCLSKRPQYKINKIKLSISMIAVTPATESTKASLASW